MSYAMGNCVVTIIIVLLIALSIQYSSRKGIAISVLLGIIVVGIRIFGIWVDDTEIIIDTEQQCNMEWEFDTEYNLIPQKSWDMYFTCPDYHIEWRY